MTEKLALTTPLQAATEPRVLAWDTEFFGVRVAATDHPDVDEWALANTVGCMCLLVDATDPARVQEAEERGFRYTDVRIQLERATEPLAVESPLPIGTHQPDDIDALAQLARRAHRITRFYADPRFDRDRCDDLYEGWLRNSAAGWAQAVLVAVAAPPAGYCTVHLDGRSASIGLIAVDEQWRGQGIGLALARSAVSFAYALEAERITVVTQGRNRAALRTFQRAGFLHAKTDVWLHRWREDA